MRKLKGRTLPRSKGTLKRNLKKRKARTAAIVGKPAARPRPTIRLVSVAEQPTAPVGRIRIGKRHRKEFGDVDSLAASIDARGGLLQPVAVKPLRDSAKYDFDLIAGERRLMAWPRTTFAGQPIPIRIVDVDKIVLGERDENLERKAFTRSEQVAIARECEPIEKAMAIVRQREHGAAPGRKAEASAEVKGRAKDRVARLVGMDRQTLDRATAIVEAAEENPAEFGKLAEQMDRTGNVNGPFNRLKILRQSKKLRDEPPPLPGGGPYRVACFDMPWASEPDQEAPAERGRAFFDYATMSTTEMVAWLKTVRPLLEHPEGCWIWFWAPNFHLIKGVAFDVLERGLGIGADDRVHIRTWRKNKIGRGKVLRGQTEQVLLCRIGKPPAINLTNQTTLIEGDVRKDSQKPDQFYVDVEALTPASRYVEFFARRKLPENWDGFGDQVGTLDTPPAPADQAPELQAPAEVFADELATVLAAIERGDDVGAKLLKRHKLVEVGYVSTAGKKLKLKAAGRTLLASRRDDARQAAETAAKLAELPDTIDGMIADYLETVRRLHVAIMGGNAAGYEALCERRDLLEEKAHGDADTGVACDDSPAEQLRRAARSPIGEVPSWGQAGIFELDVDGTPYLVKVDQEGGFDVYAKDPDRPFISETGFRSFCCAGITYGDELPPPLAIDEFCRIEIEQDLSGANEHDRKKKGKRAKLHRPQHWHRMPTSWAEIDAGDTSELPESIGGLMAERAILAAIAGKAKIPQMPDTLKHLRDMALIDDKGKITKHGKDRIKRLEAEIADMQAAAAAQPTLPGIPPADPAPGEQNSKIETVDRADRNLAGGDPENKMPRAADVRAEVDAPIIAGAHVEVRFDTRPALYGAFDKISHDSGAGAGYASYPVPQSHAGGLAEAEAALAGLTDDELTEFAIGDQAIAEVIAGRSAELARAHSLLGAFSRGWWKRDDGDDQPPADNPEGLAAAIRHQEASKRERAA